MKAVVRFMDSHQGFECKIFNAFLLAMRVHRFCHKTEAAVCLALFPNSRGTADTISPALWLND